MLLSNPHDNVFTETQCLSSELIAWDNFHILSIATCRKKKSKQIRCDSSWVNTVNRRYSYWCQPCTLEFNSRVKNRTVNACGKCPERNLSVVLPVFLSQFFLFPEKCTLTWKLAKHNIPFMFTLTHFRQLQYGNSFNTFPYFSSRATLYAC